MNILRNIAASSNSSTIVVEDVNGIPVELSTDPGNLSGDSWSIRIRPVHGGNYFTKSSGDMSVFGQLAEDMEEGRPVSPLLKGQPLTYAKFRAAFSIGDANYPMKTKLYIDPSYARKIRDWIFDALENGRCVVDVESFRNLKEFDPRTFAVSVDELEAELGVALDEPVWTLVSSIRKQSHPSAPALPDMACGVSLVKFLGLRTASGKVSMTHSVLRELSKLASR